MRVWFGTNRKPLDADDVSQGFSAFDSAEAITYGLCNVFIPESHKPGSVGTPWWRRWLRLEADDTLKLHSTHGLPRDVFWQRLANKLATRPAQCVRLHSRVQRQFRGGRHPRGADRL